MAKQGAVDLFRHPLEEAPNHCLRPPPARAPPARRPAEQRRELRRLVAALAGLGRRLRRLVDALAEQEIVEHLRATGAAERAPKPAFSTSTASAICGFSTGAKAIEERMVAQMLGDRRLGVFLVLAERHDLGGARLAGAHVACAGEGARAGAFLVDPDHGALDHFQVPGLEGMVLEA